MSALKMINLGLHFFLELGALAALAYWGFHTGSGLGMKLLLRRRRTPVGRCAVGRFPRSQRPWPGRCGHRWSAAPGARIGLLCSFGRGAVFRRPAYPGAGLRPGDPGQLRLDVRSRSLAVESSMIPKASQSMTGWLSIHILMPGLWFQIRRIVGLSTSSKLRARRTARRTYWHPPCRKG